MGGRLRMYVYVCRYMHLFWPLGSKRPSKHRRTSRTVTVLWCHVADLGFPPTRVDPLAPSAATMHRLAVLSQVPEALRASLQGLANPMQEKPGPVKSDSCMEMETKLTITITASLTSG